jgi:hypothetical protein
MAVGFRSGIVTTQLPNALDRTARSALPRNRRTDPVNDRFTHRNDIIGIFAQHPVAANLTMVIMLLAGVWGLSNLNTQFFPNFRGRGRQRSAPSGPAPRRRTSSVR